MLPLPSYETVASTELDDDFSGLSLDTSKWEELKWNIAYGETATITQASGVLTLDISSVGTGNNHLLIHTKGYYALQGDFDIQVDFELINYPASSRWFAYLQASNFYGPYPAKPTQEIRAYIGYISNRHYGGEIRLNGSPSLLEGAGGYSGATTDTSGKLRIVRSGTTGYCYYWNGASWTEVHNDTISTTDMWIRLWLASTDGGPEASMKFDNLVVNSGTVIHYL